MVSLGYFKLQNTQPNPIHLKGSERFNAMEIEWQNSPSRFWVCAYLSNDKWFHWTSPFHMASGGFNPSKHVAHVLDSHAGPDPDLLNIGALTRMSSRVPRNSSSGHSTQPRKSKNKSH